VVLDGAPIATLWGVGPRPSMAPGLDGVAHVVVIANPVVRWGHQGESLCLHSCRRLAPWAHERS
jgi:hypothetical protein